MAIDINSYLNNPDEFDILKAAISNCKELEKELFSGEGDYDTNKAELTEAYRQLFNDGKIEVWDGEEDRAKSREILGIISEYVDQFEWTNYFSKLKEEYSEDVLSRAITAANSLSENDFRFIAISNPKETMDNLKILLSSEFEKLEAINLKTYNKINEVKEKVSDSIAKCDKHIKNMTGGVLKDKVEEIKEDLEKIKSNLSNNTYGELEAIKEEIDAKNNDVEEIVKTEKCIKTSYDESKAYAAKMDNGNQRDAVIDCRNYFNNLRQDGSILNNLEATRQAVRAENIKLKQNVINYILDKKSTLKGAGKTRKFIKKYSKKLAKFDEMDRETLTKFFADEIEAKNELNNLGNNDKRPKNFYIAELFINILDREAKALNNGANPLERKFEEKSSEGLAMKRAAAKAKAEAAAKAKAAPKTYVDIREEASTSEREEQPPSYNEAVWHDRQYNQDVTYNQNNTYTKDAQINPIPEMPQNSQNTKLTATAPSLSVLKRNGSK